VSVSDYLNKLKSVVEGMRVVRPRVDVIKAEDDNAKIDAFKYIYEIMKGMSDKLNFGNYLNQLGNLVSSFTYVKDCPYTYEECLKHPEYFIKSDLHNQFKVASDLIAKAIENILGVCTPVKQCLDEYNMIRQNLPIIYRMGLIQAQTHNTFKNLLTKAHECLNIIYNQCYAITLVTPSFITLEYFSPGIDKINQLVELDYKYDEAYLLWEEKTKYRYTLDYYFYLFPPKTPINLYGDIGGIFIIYRELVGETDDYYIYLTHLYHTYYDYKGTKVESEGVKQVWAYIRKNEENYITRLTISFITNQGNEYVILQEKYYYDEVNNILKIEYLHTFSCRVEFDYLKEYIHKLGLIPIPPPPRKYYNCISYCIPFCEDLVRIQPYNDFTAKGTVFYKLVNPSKRTWYPPINLLTPEISPYQYDKLIYSNTLHDVSIENIGLLPYYREEANFELNYGDRVYLYSLINDLPKHEIYIENDHSSDKAFSESSTGKVYIGYEDNVIKRITIETSEGYITQYEFYSDKLRINCKAINDYSYTYIGFTYLLREIYGIDVSMWIDYVYFNDEIYNLNLTQEIPIRSIGFEVFH